MQDYPIVGRAIDRDVGFRNIEKNLHEGEPMVGGQVERVLRDFGQGVHTWKATWDCWLVGCGFMLASVGLSGRGRGGTL